MILCRVAAVAALVAGAGLVAPAQASQESMLSPSRPHAAAPQRMQLAQNCGWFVIGTCSRSRRDAQRAADEEGGGNGYVISTSSREYPNFRPGYYCVVEGPFDREGQAERALSRWRRAGAPRSSYIKNAC